MGTAPIPVPPIEPVVASVRDHQPHDHLDDVWIDLPSSSLRAAPFVVVVPIKGFADAKSRLTEVMSASERTILARCLAERTLAALRGFPTLVICDDVEVRDVAQQFNAAVLHVGTPGLNVAVTAAQSLLADLEVRTMAVVHSDILDPQDLGAVLETLAHNSSPTEIAIVPDRHVLGTNILVIPVAHDFVFTYGVNSFQTHCDQATERGLDVQVVHHPRLGWDVDVADDLAMLPEDLRTQLMRPT